MDSVKRLHMKIPMTAVLRTSQIDRPQLTRIGDHLTLRTKFLSTLSNEKTHRYIGEQIRKTTILKKIVGIFCCTLQL